MEKTSLKIVTSFDSIKARIGYINDIASGDVFDEDIPEDVSKALRSEIYTVRVLVDNLDSLVRQYEKELM